MRDKNRKYYWAFKAAYLKEEHKSFLCPEPLSVLYATDCGRVAGGDREGGGEEISPQWKSPGGHASTGGRWGQYPEYLYREHLQRITEKQT